MDSNAAFAILLLIAGIGILSAEVFIPSGGLLGVITFFALTCSLVFAWRAWGGSHIQIFWTFCIFLLLLIPTAIGGAFYILPRTAAGKRVLLEAPSSEQVTPFVEQSRHLQKLVGQYGRTVSPLTPGGLVNVNGERLHAISEGLIVETGQSIEVMEVRGSRLLVRPAEPPLSASKAAAAQSTRLDFEIPQS